MTFKSVLGVIVKAVTVVLALLAVYLCLTALPVFLGLAGVLSRPAAPEPIADALARLVLAFVLLGVIAVIGKLQQRIGSEA